MAAAGTGRITPPDGIALRRALEMFRVADV
jgi:hypothetical protein